MSRAFAGSTDIFVDEFDFSGVINACTIDITNPIADITSFTDVDMTYVEGKPSFTINLNGLYSTASPNYDGEMFADLTSADRLITISPSIAAATGGAAYFGQGDITSAPEMANTTSAVALNVTWNGNKPLVRGKFAYVNSALATTTNGTSYQLGALSSTQQLIAFQHVLAASGTSPTLDTTIYSDDDDAWTGATLRATFTQASDVTSEREVVSGAVTDTYWRAQMVIGGSDTPTFSVVIAFGITKL